MATVGARDQAKAMDPTMKSESKSAPSAMRGPRSWPIRAWRVAQGVTRVAAFLGVIVALGLVVVARTVRGQVAEGSLSLGRELAPFADVLHGAHRITLNGEPIYVASAVTEQPMGEVLDRFEKQCKSHTAGLAEQLDALPKAVQERVARRAPAAWSERLGILREERQEEGVVACLERREGKGFRDVVHQLRAFAKTGDLYEIGNLRYIYVRPTDHGKVHVLSSFTEGPFNVFRAIGHNPEGGQAPGTDPAGVPPLPNAKRVISAQLQGSMYASYIFKTPDTPQQAMAFYSKELPASGWEPMVGHEDMHFQVWAKNGVTMVVNASHGEGEAETHVVLSQGRNVGPTMVATGGLER